MFDPAVVLKRKKITENASTHSSPDLVRFPDPTYGVTFKSVGEPD